MMPTLVWLYLEKLSDNSHFHRVKCSVINPPSKQWRHFFPQGTRRRRHFGCGTVFWGMEGVESRANSNPVNFVVFLKRISEVSKISVCFRTIPCFSLVNAWAVSPEICTLVHCQIVKLLWRNLNTPCMHNHPPCSCTRHEVWISDPFFFFFVVVVRFGLKYRQFPSVVAVPPNLSGTPRAHCPFWFVVLCLKSRFFFGWW